MTQRKPPPYCPPALLDAYAQGYWEGRGKGYGTNPYEFEQAERNYWWAGYDSGVADYCREAHPEEQE